MLIDTQGAVGELQKSVAMAADFMVSPVVPDVLSEGELATGTLAMLDELNGLAGFGESFRSGNLPALLNAHERTVNAGVLATVLPQHGSASLTIAKSRCSTWSSRRQQRMP